MEGLLLRLLHSCQNSYLCSTSNDTTDRDELANAISFDLTDGSGLGLGGALEVHLIPAHQLLGEVVGSRTGINKSES